MSHISVPPTESLDVMPLPSFLRPATRGASAARALLLPLEWVLMLLWYAYRWRRSTAVWWRGRDGGPVGYAAMFLVSDSLVGAAWFLVFLGPAKMPDDGFPVWIPVALGAGLNALLGVARSMHHWFQSR